MKKKLLVIIMSCVLAFSSVAGCGSKENSESAASEETVAAEDNASTEESAEAVDTASTEESAEAEDSTSTEVSTEATLDRSGNEIVLPETVNSIVSMAPSTTRILIDLGLADKIVACDTYSFGSYGSELKADIPQFDMMTPDQEQLIALGADIIFTSGMSASHGTDVFSAVRESGACIADIPSSASIADIEEDITFIGKCVGAEDEAGAIVADMKEEIDAITAIGSTISDDEKKSVLFELYTPSADNPVIYTAGNGTYINEMLELIGAKNVAATEADQWPALSEETAVAANPDVILTADMYTPDVINVILTMKGWENVNAVVNNQVYQLSSDDVNQPNQHIVDAMIEMAKAIYPEKYEEFK